MPRIQHSILQTMQRYCCCLKGDGNEDRDALLAQNELQDDWSTATLGRSGIIE